MSYSNFSPEAQKEIDATIWKLERDYAVLPKERESLRFLLANLVLSCSAADGQDAWKRMYYDLRRQFEGENLTDKQIAEKAQTHREFMFQEGQLRDG